MPAYIINIVLSVGLGIFFYSTLEMKVLWSILSSIAIGIGLIVSEYLNKAGKLENSKLEAKWPFLVAYALTAIVLQEIDWSEKLIFIVVGLVFASFELGRLQQFINSKRCQYILITVLENDREVLLLKKGLNSRHIPHLITTFREFKFENNKKRPIAGKVFAPKEFEAEILSYVSELRNE